MNVLHLTLKKKWFDLIASGVKKEEYRECKPYWQTRLLNRNFEAVCFRNGYGKDAPAILVEFKGIFRGLGIIEWGAPYMVPVYVLKLGKIIMAKKPAPAQGQQEGGAL